MGMTSAALRDALDNADQFEKAGKPQVPALALTLLAASIGDTNQVTNSVIESLQRERDIWKRRALRAEHDVQDVVELHAMLGHPRYARRLVYLLKKTELPWENALDDNDEDSQV
jgi:hypothetical protein